MRLLLLEDDQILCETLEHFLSMQGYTIDVAYTMGEAENLTFDNRYDLYLFDINLPQGSGLELLEALRNADDETPTIFITALSDMRSLSESFKLGAMDYIRKPFDPEELIIRIEAKFKNDTITYGAIFYDPVADILRKDGKIIDIGNVQYKILIVLLHNIGKLVPKDILYECLEHVSDTALRVAITKIKQRLDIDIQNIRAKGYMLETL